MGTSMGWTRGGQQIHSPAFMARAALSRCGVALRPSASLYPGPSSFLVLMNIIAVVVTFHPEFDVLSALLSALKTQVDSVVVVDNGSGENFVGWLDRFHSQGVHGIFLGTNIGVATAQNAGVDWARQQKADCVVLFDQDSLPAPDMVRRLAEVIQAKHEQGCKVAAAGPQYIDERNPERPSFLRVGGLAAENPRCEAPGNLVLTDFVISSGALIPLATLDEVGGMMDCLFIDQIDIEWGLRAKSFGYQSYGVCAATMRHSLGEDPTRFLGRKLLHHSSLRHYYIFRNAVWLLFKPYISLGWKWLFIRMLVLRLGFYALMVSSRLSHMKMMTLGIWHGLFGRMGAFKESR
jgi:rhamnosyltransferase